MTLKSSSSLALNQVLRLPDSLRPLTEDQEYCREFVAGEIVVGPEKGDERIRFVISGELSLVLIDDNGERVLVDRFGPGDIFGGIDFFTGTSLPSRSELQADHHGWILYIHPDYFERMLKDDPAFTLPLISKLVKRVIDLERTIFKTTLEKKALKALVSIELDTTLERAALVLENGTIRPDDPRFDGKQLEREGKFNLLGLKPLRQAILSPLFPAIIQSAATPFFFILLAFLFLGPADPLKNPAALFGWALGWPILIVGSFVCARLWCSVCPIGTMGKLAKKLVSLERPFPSVLKDRSDFLIAGAVLFVIWFETATGLRNYPAGLGLLLITMLVSAVVVAIIFERQSWCLYLCGLGGMVGVLAKTSILELRADSSVCTAKCNSNDCFEGNGSNEGCPFGQSVPQLNTNRVCKLCGTCIRNCPHGAIRLNLRLPGHELWQNRQGKPGTAFLVIGLIGGLLSELASKTSLYHTIAGYLPLPATAKFTVFFVALVAVVNLLMALSALVSSHTYGESFLTNYSRYGMALLPLTLAAFMAFHVYYLINLGVQLPILLSHNLDFDVSSTIDHHSRSRHNLCNPTSCDTDGPCRESHNHLSFRKGKSLEQGNRHTRHSTSHDCRCAIGV